MTCPYAERKGFIVYCRLTGKHVNPLTRPCLSGDYTRCPDYREYLARKGAAPTPEAREARAAPIQQQPPRIEFRDEYSAKLLDPIHLAVLIARSKHIDSTYGRPIDILAWAANHPAGKGKTLRLDLTCPEEGWSAILLLHDGVYTGAYVETREGEKLAGRSAWNLIRGSECQRAAALLYEVTG